MAGSARADDGGGWFRLEDDRAEAEKKHIRKESGGASNDAITPSLVPGMDPSTMMVSLTDEAGGGTCAYFIVVN